MTRGYRPPSAPDPRARAQLAEQRRVADLDALIGTIVVGVIVIVGVLVGAGVAILALVQP